MGRLLVLLCVIACIWALLRLGFSPAPADVGRPTTERRVER